MQLTEEWSGNVDARVDRALQDNRRAETIVIGMALGIFVLGVVILLVAYWQRNAYVAGGALVVQGFLYWPVREILKLRRDNLILQTFPALISNLSPSDAGREIVKLLVYLRRR
jgi:hypothetical protein